MKLDTNQNIKSASKSVAMLKKLFAQSKNILVIYLVYLIVGEILISGGRYENDLYLEIVSLIIIISLSLYFVVKKPFENSRRALQKGFMDFIVFAILDFLVVNLLLNNNSATMYKFWGTFTNYGIILVLPYLLYMFKIKQIKTARPEILQSYRSK